MNRPGVPGERRDFVSWLRYAVILLVLANVLLLVVDASRDNGRDSAAGSEPAVSSAPDGVPEIRLLRELATGEVDVTGVECFTVGPFEHHAQAGEVRAALMEFTLSVTLRGTGESLNAEDGPVPPLWLDYAQAPGTVLAAQRIAAVVDPDLHRPVPCVAIERPRSP